MAIWSQHSYTKPNVHHPGYVLSPRDQGPQEHHTSKSRPTSTSTLDRCTPPRFGHLSMSFLGGFVFTWCWYAGPCENCWKINKNIFVQIRNGETSDDKLSSRLSFFSKVVKEIVVFVPFVPSCLIKASVQNVEELPLSKKVHMTTVVSLLVSQTFTGTTAIAVLKKLALAWVFPSGFTNVLCMRVIASKLTSC